MSTPTLLAGIDAGGTTFKLGVADAEGRLFGSARVPTTTPDETIAASIAALEDLAASRGGRIGALGIASFGPVDVDPGSSAYGTILDTPKPGWARTPLLERMTAGLGCPGALDTDVNGALLAEMEEGAAVRTTRAAYVTIGTGVGVGAMAGGQLAGRPFHPEIGHIRVPRAPGDDYPGLCPFHRDCLEGLASGPALAGRAGPLEAAGADHPVWQTAGFYLAQLCVTLTLSFRPQRIVLGGGVMAAPALLPAIHHAYDRAMAAYVADVPTGDLIVAAGLGQAAGLKGALILARGAL